MRVVLVVVAALAVACSKPAPPTLVPKKVVATRIDLSGITLDIVVDATNPNSADLSASGISSHLVVDKTHDVGTVTVPGAITLPAGKTTKVEVPVSLRWSDVGLLAQLAASTGSVPTRSRARSTWAATCCTSGSRFTWTVPSLTSRSPRR
jgi:hypothetical protein